MSHSQRAAQALGQLAEVDPALAALALWCRHRDDDGATRTRGETILYGPDFAALGLAEQVGLVAHHVLHVALRHGPRSEALQERLGPRFDATLYALAADAVVNETLRLADFALPRPFVTLTELLARIGESAPSAREALADWDVDRLAMRLHRDGRSAQAARDYGREKRFARDLEPDGGGTDDRQSPADWRGHLARAMAAGRTAGSGVGMLAALLADLAPPRIPWERRLRGLMARALTDHPRPGWQRPAGRWVAAEAEARARGRPVPVFEPGRQRRDWRARVVVGLDTSSSVDPLTLELFAAEVDGIAARSGAEVHLLGFDEAVHHEERLRAGLQGAVQGLELRSGGGTDFRPVILRATQLAPSALVLLTDLDGPVGPPPPCPVIWAGPEGRCPPPPFGTLVEIPA